MARWSPSFGSPLGGRSEELFFKPARVLEIRYASLFALFAIFDVTLHKGNISHSVVVPVATIATVASQQPVG